MTKPLFIGTYVSKIDKHNRCVFPAAFRKLLRTQPKFVVNIPIDTTKVIFGSDCAYFMEQEPLDNTYRTYAINIPKDTRFCVHMAIHAHLGKRNSLEFVGYGDTFLIR